MRSLASGIKIQRDNGWAPIDSITLAEVASLTRSLSFAVVYLSPASQAFLIFRSSFSALKRWAILKSSACADSKTTLMASTRGNAAGLILETIAKMTGFLSNQR